MALENYREGVALQVDLLDAQDREATAELDLVAAYYQALESSALVARAVGALPAQDWIGGFGVAPPQVTVQDDAGEPGARSMR